jgi:hypothetical protein
LVSINISYWIATTWCTMCKVQLDVRRKFISGQLAAPHNSGLCAKTWFDYRLGSTCSFHEVLTRADKSIQYLTFRYQNSPSYNFIIHWDCAVSCSKSLLHSICHPFSCWWDLEILDLRKS